MNARVIIAVFRRNFNSYFASPTGYVFICVFMLVTTIAAFWPAEFFSANLANLDQLNKWLPLIMLVFIPTISMAIWAEERRQGTDELLLTIPAADFDVVLGKYLAAVAIFSVSLLFSLVCNLLVLALMLGIPDIGLFIGTYIGYWMVGIAMLAVGMVASFLTSNLTVGFILGVIFNVPLVFAGYAEVISKNPTWTELTRQWSIGEQFRDFGRGVLSLASASYFLLIVAVMIYLSMVLIGRRHWMGGRDGRSMGGHYLVRAIALVAIAAGVHWLFQRFDWRLDVTEERISSLSPDTRKLIGELEENDKVVTVKAYVSPQVPEKYVETRLNLLSTLRELEKRSGGKVDVQVIPTEPSTEEAANAEQQFGIRANTVLSKAKGGAYKDEEIFMGAAFICGLEKVVVPFFDLGTPVEYEAIRSICTAAEPKRKKLGVLTTDAEMFGGMDFQTFQPRAKQPIIEELEKQYEVVQVDPNQPIAERFDVLMAVQPSSLTPPQLNNFVAAVKSGQPTAIFEDPMPVWLENVPGTSQEKRPRNNPMAMMGGRPPPQEPKGDITQLWRLLGVELVGKQSSSPFGESKLDAMVVWQDYNPYPKSSGFSGLTPQFVFIERGVTGNKTPFNDEHPISARLKSLFLPFPGGLTKLNASSTSFTPLISTGNLTGTIGSDDVLSARGSKALRAKEKPTGESYVIAAHIKGALKTENLPMADETAPGAEPTEESAAAEDEPKVDSNEATPADAAKEDGASKEKTPPQETTDAKARMKKEAPKKSELNVVLVADADLLHSNFFRLRAQPDEEIGWNFDNVTFVLNVLDELADDERFVEIRKRRPAHRRLDVIEASTEASRSEAAETRKSIQEKFETAEKEAKDAQEKAVKKLQDTLTALQKQEDVNPRDVEVALRRVDRSQKFEEKRLETRVEQLKREYDAEMKESERNLNAEIKSKQNRAKLWAVLLPPILPLAVAFLVFFNRRAKEREGVAKSRLR